MGDRLWEASRSVFIRETALRKKAAHAVVLVWKVPYKRLPDGGALLPNPGALRVLEGGQVAANDFLR